MSRQLSMYSLERGELKRRIEKAVEVTLSEGLNRGFGVKSN